MKKTLLFLVCLLLTGCSTEVVIKIDNEEVIETIKISDLKSNVYENNVLREDISSNLEDFEREYEFYDINEFEENGYVGKTYGIKGPIEIWPEMSHVRPCYEMFKLEKTDTNITLNTSEEYRCGYLFGANDVTLIIESDLELVSSNADKTEGNKLIWYINDENYKNKSINFNYKIIDLEQLAKEKKQTQFLTYIFIFLGITVLIGVIYVYKKNKESNKL